jgi:hypothetical protein
MKILEIFLRFRRKSFLFETLIVGCIRPFVRKSKKENIGLKLKSNGNYSEQIWATNNFTFNIEGRYQIYPPVKKFQV